MISGIDPFGFDRMISGDASATTRSIRILQFLAQVLCGRLHRRNVHPACRLDKRGALTTCDQRRRAWEIAPSSYHLTAAATRISFANSSGVFLSAEKDASGISIAIVVMATLG